MSFNGLDEDLLRRVLDTLENEWKCNVFKGETSDSFEILVFVEETVLQTGTKKIDHLGF
jgi:hypothetical protein